MEQRTGPLVKIRNIFNLCEEIKLFKLNRYSIGSNSVCYPSFSSPPSPDRGVVTSYFGWFLF